MFLIINNHSFHKSKFVNSANEITGGFYQKTSEISDYLHLKKQNTALTNENINLKNHIEKLRVNLHSTREKSIIISTDTKRKYQYIDAKIIKNEYHKAFNFLTINKGKKDSVTPEMAVINGKGIIGMTDASTNNYARVQSILNKNSKINARLKNSYYFGTLIWNGENYNTVQLIDIPRQVKIKLGDTIVTGGKSTIFPGGILIGKVIKTHLGTTAINSIDIELFNDMSNLGNIYIVKNFQKEEIKSLENKQK
jgi:rod shape-determining protein MreC